ncbi:MAG: hypothetical protein H5U40_01150 [Polyangiaceae bacterium]|nr:hypothetical protein [Polyangiaceae bacterium]
MPLSAWKPPSATVLTLRTIMRRIHSPSKSLRRAKNQLHAAEQTATTPEAVLEDLAEGVRALERRITRLEREAGALVRSDAPLGRRLALLVSVRGIAERSALQLLSEIAVLPEDMTAKQWVAHAGLDPRSSQARPSTNHRGFRGAATGTCAPRSTCPASPLAHRDDHGHAFYAAMVGRGKRLMQATVAVMRKLLHVLHAMFRRDELWNGARLPSDRRACSVDDFFVGALHSGLTENRLSIRHTSTITSASAPRNRRRRRAPAP